MSDTEDTPLYEYDEPYDGADADREEGLIEKRRQENEDREWLVNFEHS